MKRYTITKSIVTFSDGTKHVDRSPIKTDDLENTRTMLKSIYGTHQSCRVLFTYEERSEL